MANSETIDNFLFDEENAETQANDLWDRLSEERKDTVDDRSWSKADSLSHRHDLNRQIADMMNRVLTDDEEEAVRLYYGIDRHRHSISEIAEIFGSRLQAMRLLQSAMEKMKYSDEILSIYKYLYK